MRSLLFALGVPVCCQFSLAAQSQTGTVRVQVRAAQKPIEDAEVVVAGTSHRTDAAGTSTVVISAGNVDHRRGARVRARVHIRAGRRRGDARGHRGVGATTEP